MYQLENVNVSFGKTTILKNVSLAIQKHQLVTLVGKSGSGKSTLLKVLAGYLETSNGAIWLNQKNICVMKPEQRLLYCTDILSFVWQDFKLIKEMTVKHNILLPLFIHKKTLDKVYFKKIVSMLGIEHLLNKMPQEISGGEQQRCALARALITKPRVMIADEPTGALDSATSQKLVELIQLCLQEFVETVIIATHDTELANIGDMKLMIQDGQVLSI
ncbi:ATP-binding cassette domain-containing protein [Granulicatella sp. zg-ZJ]|uniref:ABC transporter ATP-binding protein n=1 Tax=unclassified Granulicatella TaxID=2630493 RepID=UPI0013C01971|nr:MULTISPECIES: ATP-binding cassette domain-containing protein [unclassified Granulicatella]MBS4749613.1 ATP-binding cassette domain-containing protein [Carnobacteriaceae bacterium zg-ZUI78]NEW62416.1 ATP-binding cassette domain-containing protein [Granulicatella sp. zg-ZJ]NEW66340.1 ATP-binding cassette domain-containing protein [Granulicatella sp. zg-84]QMI86484.1 ATP-binding cassette domain-containing protein [Carnobacteriaceae bacterium zg-84]